MFDGSEPLFLQIADHVRQQIRLGTLRPGDQVMSTTQFATTYKINPATAAKGFSVLVQEGLIEKRRGVGMFVTDSAHADIISRERDTFFDDQLNPVIEQAKALGIPKAEVIGHLDATW